MQISRRHFLKLSAMGGALAATSQARAVSILEPDSGIEFVSNPSLSTVLEGFPGNPLKDDRFLNLDRISSDKSFTTVFKWFLSENPQKNEKKNDPFRLKVQMIDSLNDIRDNCMIWLGHSSFLFHFDRHWILTDPCLTDLPFKSRRAALPIRIGDLAKTDYVLISHGHYDHLDNETVSQFLSRKTQALTPLNMTGLIRSMNRFVDVQEAGWYQRYSLDTPFTVTFLPAKHWYLRAPWDRNKILWGSFMIEYKSRKFYFAGDSAYDGHFKAISDLFGEIDYCFMPIGAYKPEYIMQSNHMNPGEAVQAYLDLKGKHFIPIHYGTYDLADEPVGEPIRWLKKLSDENRFQKLLMPGVGEVIPLS